MDLLKRLTDLDNWNFVQEKDKVKLYDNTTDSVLFVRGDAKLEGHELTPEQMAIVVTFLGTRTHWDPYIRHGYVFPFEHSRFESLFVADLNTEPRRHLSCVCVREIKKDVCYTAMSSVEDPRIPMGDSVRADLLVSGWRIQKTETGLDVSYITKIDLKGCVLDELRQQVPLCVGKAVEYAEKNGYPPTLTVCTAQCKYENFFSGRNSYMAILEGPGHCSWSISKKMYPLGLCVIIKGDVEYRLGAEEFSVSEMKGRVEVYIKCVGKKFAREAGVRVYHPKIYKVMPRIHY
ncbi:hypothetical protein INT47_008931 [Mucor saturninus]|uniref:START domain-containing protein n=1 Tax=Mucor saturninus TaxID=64648 RepID=A0A8H7V6A1_9FUNG|nr:hypothetical protein INT47_008931 [Mucor saturninus]